MPKLSWTFAAALVCVGCAGDDADDSTTVADATAADDDDGSSSGDESSGHHDESSGHNDESSGHNDESTGHHDETGNHDTGTDSGTTGQTVCEILGEGCHDNMTPEGIDCHLLGHDGDEAACMEVFDMCAEICGL